MPSSPGWVPGAGVAAGTCREEAEHGEGCRVMVERGFTGVSVPAGPALGAKTSGGKEATKRPGQGGESQLSSVIKANKT